MEQEGKAWILCSSGKLVDMMNGAAPESCAVVTGLTLVDPAVGMQSAVGEEETLRHSQLLEMLEQLRSKGMLQNVQEIHLEDEEMQNSPYPYVYI